MNKEIDIILARYFSGEASQKELRALDVWLSQSDENKKYFHQMTLLYQYTGQSNNTPAFDTESALARFKNYMGQESPKAYEPNKNLKNSGFFYRIAAVVILLAVSAFTLYYFVNRPSTVHFIAKATQEKRTLFKNTDVTLFAGSEITYNKEDTSKIIQLEGMATFNVSRKSSEISKGITVKAGEVCIKDIGTIFTVDASEPDKAITVEVAEGEVWFYANVNNGVQIKANEAAVYYVPTKQFKKTKDASPKAQPSNRSNEEEARKDTAILNEIIFQNTPLQEAIAIIEVRYGVAIDIVFRSTTSNSILLNASFDKNESVEYILEIITETISAKLSKDGNIYIITL